MANSRANSSGLLFNPNTYDPPHFDPETRRQLRALIDWFESRGKARLLQDDLDAEWVSDFLDFIGKERIFARLQIAAHNRQGDTVNRILGLAKTEKLPFGGHRYHIDIIRRNHPRPLFNAAAIGQLHGVVFDR